MILIGQSSEGDRVALSIGDADIRDVTALISPEYARHIAVQLVNAANFIDGGNGPGEVEAE